MYIFKKVNCILKKNFGMKFFFLSEKSYLFLRMLCAVFIKYIILTIFDRKTHYKLAFVTVTN